MQIIQMLHLKYLVLSPLTCPKKGPVENILWFQFSILNSKSAHIHVI